ncbi:MAG: cytochrome c family protein [Pseudomonadota bacterium]|nr:cytochrome c family protein [Pseudomonadota bacterium]
MNTFELTKIMGGFCGALLLLLLIQWSSELIYHSSHKKMQAAYILEIETEEIEAAVVKDEIPFMELVNAADIGKGKKVYSKCKACHKLEKGANGTGPYLYGVVGRAQGAVQDYNYSAVLSEMGKVWNEEELNKFILKPSAYAPGTKMNYSGLANRTDRANLIGYLKTFSD